MWCTSIGKLLTARWGREFIARPPHQPLVILSSTLELGWAPLTCGWWQINSILANIGHRNSIRIFKIFLSRFVIGWSKHWCDWSIYKETWGCLGFPSSHDCFFFHFCTISVWISIQIPGGMDGPMKHETSARCRVSRSVKQSNNTTKEYRSWWGQH